MGFYFIFVWKRLIRGSGKPGKLREFNFAKFVNTVTLPSSVLSSHHILDRLVLRNFVAVLN